VTAAAWPSAIGQKAQWVFWLLGDLFYRKRPRPRGRELYGQRYSVQLAAQHSYCLSVSLRQPKTGVGRLCPLHEQADRLVTSQISSGELLLGVGQREAWHHPNSLADYAQRLTAGRQDLEVRAGSQQGIDEHSAPLNQVLAVVQNHQRLSGLQMLHECLGQRTIRRLAHA
jgi:hypothetical protein